MKQCDNTNVRKSKESILLFFFFASGGPPGALPGGSCGGLFNKLIIKLIKVNKTEVVAKFYCKNWLQNLVAKSACKKVHAKI